MFDRQIGNRLGKEDDLNNNGLRTLSRYRRKCCIDLSALDDHRSRLPLALAMGGVNCRRRIRESVIVSLWPLARSDEVE